MKKLLVILLSLCFITGCNNTVENKNEKSNNKTTSTSTTSLPSSSRTTSSTVVTTTSTSTISSSSTSKVTLKTSPNKTTTTNRITKVNVTTKKTTTTSKIVLTEDEVKRKILELKSKYPNGTSWTNENREYWFKASNMTNYRGHGCVAFAFMASDAAFGSLPVKELKSFDVIRVGDIIRYLNNSHSVIVLEVKDNSVIVAEGNIIMNDSQGGVVYWGREVLKQEIKNTGTYIYTRWT